MSNGSVEIAERERNGDADRHACAAASPRGCARSAPTATSRSSQFDGDRGLADGLLTGFADAAAPPQRASRLSGYFPRCSPPALTCGKEPWRPCPKSSLSATRRPGLPFFGAASPPDGLQS